MEQYWPRVDWLYQTGAARLGSIFATFDGCPPFLDSHRFADLGRSSCDAYEPGLMRYADDAHAVRIVFAASWFYYDFEQSLHDRMGELFDGFAQTISRLRRAGNEVYVVLQIPGGPLFDPRNLRWTVLRSDANIVVNRREAAARFSALMTSLSRVAAGAGAAVIDPMDYFCSASACPVLIDGDPVYTDMGHLRASYVRERAVFIDPILR